MRIAATILSFFFLHTAKATTYYVSTAGSNAADGLTIHTSWQTISKVNGFTFASGDSILFRCGDTWNERLNVPASNLNFASYSTGNKPIITGLATAPAFTQSGNIYTTTLSDAVSTLNNVTINGIQGIKARFPNSVYLTYSTGSTTSLTTTLTGTPSYTGFEIAVKTAHWVIDISRVSNQTVGALTLSPALSYNPASFGCNGYFFQNDSTLLDSASEWCYYSSNGKLKVYATSTPAVQYSNLDTLVYCRQKTGVTFNNINITGANKAGLIFDTCSFITVQNCSINNMGTNGARFKKTHHVTISGDSVTNCLNDGLVMGFYSVANGFTDTCKSATIANNYIKNIGVYPGMGLGADIAYFGIYCDGDSLNIHDNIIDTIGYVPIYWRGRSGMVKYNYITHFSFIKDDVGGIYTYVGSASQIIDTGSIVRKNIVRYGKAATAGTVLNTSFSIGGTGIYLDNYTNGVLVDSNTCIDNENASIYLNEAYSNTIRANNFYDSAGYNFYGNGATARLYSNNFYSNNYCQRDVSKLVYYIPNSTTPFTASDSNYYLRRSIESNLIQVSSTTYGPTQFQTAGYEAHGSLGSTQIYSLYGAIAVYNATAISADVAINGTYTDAQGNVYFETVPLSPFTGKILLPSKVRKSNVYTPH